MVFDKPGLLFEKLKILTSSNYHRVQYFLLKLRTCFFLTNVYKRVFRIFSFCLDFQLFAKIKKDLVSTHPFFTSLLITQDLNKIKKIPNTLFETILSKKRAWNFNKKILNFVVVGVCQSFQFIRHIAWFLGNNTALSKFRYRILYNLISITKL